MTQLNNSLSEMQEEKTAAILYSDQPNSDMLTFVRDKFYIFGGLTLLFGGALAACFYRSGIGINLFVFTLIAVMIVRIIMRKLTGTMKKSTTICLSGVLLLGLSSALTASEPIHFLNAVGILLLLDIALLYQFHSLEQWDVVSNINRIFGLLFYSIISIGYPFVDAVNCLKRTKYLKNDKIRNIILGLCIVFPILLIILLLLSSADLMFGELTKNIFRFVLSPSIIQVTFVILFGFVASYSILCGVLAYVPKKEVGQEKKKADASIAITAFVCLCLVYLLFCGIQIIYLFSNGLFQLPLEFTFSAYARRGFFELLTVTLINIVIILGTITLFQENKLLRILFTVMTICTYIMIASAAYRMIMYISVYNLTFLRLFVLLFLLVDGLLLAGIIIWVYRRTFPLFSYGVCISVICYLLFVFAKPDYFIALYHINHREELTYGDYIFLTRELSMDAVPAVLPILYDTELWENWGETKSYKDYGLKENYRKEYIAHIEYKTSNKDVREFNISYYIAKQMISEK